MIRRSILPRTLGGWLKLLMVMAVLVVGFAVLLLYTTPRWYAPLDSRDQRVIDLAERARDNILDFHNKLEQLPLGQSQWSITQNEINSFLAEYGEEINPRGAHVSNPVVIFRPEEITMAARVAGVPGTGSAGGVITLVAHVVANAGAGPADTAIQVTLSSVKLGSLPLPPSLLQKAVPQLSAAIAAALAKSVDATTIDRLLRGQAVPVSFLYRRHLVYIKDLQVTGGKLTVVMTR